MSRPIKFRCWFNSRMWYGIPCVYFNDNGISRIDLNDEDDDRCLTPDTWTGADDYEVMQFTGLYDREGREIWEGDIVLLDRKADEPWEAHYNPNVASFLLCEPVSGASIRFSDADVFEVIGNIYEHSHLLEPEG